MQDSYDVVIVGAGPVGTTLANLLGRYGVSTLVADKEPDIVTIPRAIGICEEGSRVLSAAGVLQAMDGRIHAIKTVSFEKTLGERMFFMEIDQDRNGYAELRTFFQPELETCLRDGLEAYDHVDIALATECVGLADRGTHVDLTLRADGRSRSIRTRFVVACDGAGSPVRKLLDIPFAGRTYSQDWLILDADRDPIPGNVVVPFGDPDRPGITLPAPGGRRRWEFVVKDDDDRDTLLSDASVRRLLAPWGNADDMAIARRAIYTFHSRIAQRFKQGNVFLAGDAAHITPPFAGQGLMAGLRDTHNLAWKLAGVLRGQLDEAILDTYGTERIPQVYQVNFFAKFLGSILLPQSRWSVMARDMVIRLTRRLGLHSATKPLAARKMANHVNGSALRNALVTSLTGTGFALPQFAVTAADGLSALLDSVAGDHFYLVTSGAHPAQLLPADLVRQWRAVGGRYLLIKPGRPGSVATRDEPGTLTVWDENAHYHDLLKDPDTILALRPDKIIALNTHGLKLERQLRRYLATLRGEDAVTTVHKDTVQDTQVIAAPFS